MRGRASVCRERARAQIDACGINHLVTIEADGSVSGGSKGALRRAVDAGEPVRVGWAIEANHDGAADLSHWTDARLMTEFEGEVFARGPIQRSRA